MPPRRWASARPARRARAPVVAARAAARRRWRAAEAREWGAQPVEECDDRRWFRATAAHRGASYQSSLFYLHFLPSTFYLLLLTFTVQIHFDQFGVQLLPALVSLVSCLPSRAIV